MITHKPLATALALGAIALSAISAMMPWLTIDFGFGSKLSFNLVDFLNLVDFSNHTAGQVLQTIQSALYFNPYQTVQAPNTVFLLLLAIVFYGLTIGTAVLSFLKAEYVVFSGGFGIATALLGILGIETLKGYVAQGLRPEYAALVRPDYGIYLVLMAGFVFLGAYFVMRQGVSREPVEETSTSMMYCRECGARIPRDSKFCKECGAKLV